MINNDPRSTYDEIIPEPSRSRGIIKRIIHDSLKMEKIAFRWIPHQLRNGKKGGPVRLCRDNLHNFTIVAGDCLILLQTMRHGFIIGKLVINQSTQAGLLKVSHQSLLFVEVLG